MGNPRLDPEVETLLKEMQEQGASPVYTMSPEEARKEKNPFFISLGGPPEEIGGVRDITVPGPAGEIPLRVYTPDGDGPFPALVYFHGGGWVICNLDTHDSVCRALAKQASCVVVSVDYRLAPEHKFPAAAEDAFAATLWVAENAAKLDVDPARLAVGGDSAGGNLTAVVCLMARGKGEPSLVHQVLIYPVTDVSNMDTNSYREHAEGYILTKEGMRYYRDHYVRDANDLANPHVSPLLAQSLNGLPPATIITAELDVLTDEGEAYAERLRQAGVPVNYTCYEGMIHAFWNLGGVLSSARKAREEVSTALGEAFNA
jgi:acetyl esterase